MGGGGVDVGKTDCGRRLFKYFNTLTARSLWTECIILRSCIRVHKYSPYQAIACIVRKLK